MAFDWLKRLVGKDARPASDAPRPAVPPMVAAVFERARDPGTFDERARRAGPVSDVLALPAVAALQLIRDTLPVYVWYREANADYISRRGRLYSRDPGYWEYHAPLTELEGMLARLLRRKLPVTADDLKRLLSVVLHARQHLGFLHPPVLPLLGQIERFVKTNALSTGVVKALKQLRSDAKRQHLADDSAIQRRIEQLLQPQDQPAPAAIGPGDPWTERALADLDMLPDADRAAWLSLLEHCARAKSAKPSATWLRTADSLVGVIGWDRFVEAIERWFALVAFVDRGQGRWPPPTLPAFVERHEVVLKGLAWCCAARGEARVAGAVHDLAARTLKKIANVGPWAVKVGNAAIWALGQMPGLEGASRLILLENRIKTPSLQSKIERAWNQAAEREGVRPTDLAESAIPTYGLTVVGVRAEQFGEFTAELRVLDASKVELTWVREDGKCQKSVPAAVKEGHAAELKALKAAQQDIRKMLPAERQRLDALCRSQRTWPLGQWRERFSDHPLTGTLARRLIWTFGEGDNATAGIWSDAGIVSSGGEVMSGDLHGPVALWHPIEATVEDVRAWRALLDARGITQPFKQAHREIYVLTDAERATGTYSNRFAGHIIRQHQFHSLCEQRGWAQRLAGAFDSDALATLALPDWGMRVEFWSELATGGDANLAASGIALYLATDQVRFYALGAAHDAPTPLDQVPARLLTEVFRDVDLFVGVGSVGNNPEWQDGGPDGRYGAYWQSFSFGELGANAQTRREVLERLLPRLRIAKRCEVQGRFLVVRGSRRVYKIHLGSANILMEPNDQYLCIVRAPARATGQADQVMLPFEGDGTFATILSKAFMLADDAKITDPTILSQIARR